MGDDRWWDHMDDVMNGGHMGGSAWWPLWWLLLLLLVGAVVALVVMGTGRRSGPPTPHAPMPGEPPGRPGEDAAESVLRERYARGEIDESEYDARLARLRASR